ncbi:MAG: ferric reductase-like transmembrane domain-containing protein [Pseudomonadota bacterium]
MTATRLAGQGATRSRLRGAAIWAALATALILPLAVAATSPQLAWREPVYIIGGFAGVMGLALMVLQPLLAAGYLPGLGLRAGRRAHGWIGAALVAAVTVHVGGLWITSPPDVIDVLLFRSPTPFGVWGAVAMWAVVAAALLALVRRRWRLSPRIWRVGHTALAVIGVISTVVHAMLIEGTMGQVSKALLCALVLVVAIKVAVDLRAWTLLLRRRA